MFKKFSMKKQETIWGYIFVFPWIIGFICFIAGPMLFSLLISFTDYSLVGEVHFIGLQNFQEMFHDSVFWVSFKNTFVYAIVSIPLVTAGGVIVAVLLNRAIFAQRTLKTVFYLPSMMVGVGLYFLWMLILNPQSGLVNGVLDIFGINGPNWLSDPAWTKPSIILMNLWGLGGQMLLYLARLQSIPEDLYESARIDGASNLKMFFKITIPMLSPIIFYNLIVGTIGAFQIFQEGYIFSNDGTGGPAQSLLFYNLYLWQNAFTYYKTGFAAAMSWFLFLIVFSLTMVNQKISKKWVYEEGE